MRRIIIIVSLLITGCSCSINEVDKRLHDKCKAGNTFACEQYEHAKQQREAEENDITSYCDHGNRIYVKRQTDAHLHENDSITAVRDASCDPVPAPASTPG